MDFFRQEKCWNFCKCIHFLILWIVLKMRLRYRPGSLQPPDPLWGVIAFRGGFLTISPFKWPGPSPRNKSRRRHWIMCAWRTQTLYWLSTCIILFAAHYAISTKKKWAYLIFEHNREYPILSTSTHNTEQQLIVLNKLDFTMVEQQFFNEQISN